MKHTLDEPRLHIMINEELKSWAKLPDDIESLVFDRFRDFEKFMPGRDEGCPRVGDVEKEGEGKGAKGLYRYYRKNTEGKYYGYKCGVCLKKIIGMPEITLLREPLDDLNHVQSGCKENIYLKFVCIRPACKELLNLKFLGYM